MENFFRISELEHLRQQTAKRYLEFLRLPAMSAGVYSLSAGEVDPQSPHKEDEVYYVIRGRAQMQIDETDQLVGPGSVIFVAAGVNHKFHTIEEELLVLVFFAPMES